MYFTVLGLHILAATIWTGGHLILATIILPRALKARDPGLLLGFEEGYEKIGMPALVVQVLTGVWMAWQMVPELARWIQPQDGLEAAITVKLALLATTALLALNARFRVIPCLSAETLPLMGWHIRAVTVISVLFVLTGVLLRSGGF